jgi:hypothetical protein
VAIGGSNALLEALPDNGQLAQMAKAEYDKRLAEIRAELVERSKAENARHDAVLGQYRTEFRQKILALQAEFDAGCTAVDLPA